MASPKLITFLVLNPSTGVPITGIVGSLSFATYKDETGANLPQPTFVEIGGGLYYFIPSYTTNHGIAYVISTSNTPSYFAGYTRPEDWNTDNIDGSVAAVLSAISAIAADVTLIKKLEKNKWAIVTSGPDANKMVFYDDDNTTPILKVALTDVNGVPTSTNPYARTPTS